MEAHKDITADPIPIPNLVQSATRDRSCSCLSSLVYVVFLRGSDYQWG